MSLIGRPRPSTGPGGGAGGDLPPKLAVDPSARGSGHSVHALRPGGEVAAPDERSVFRPKRAQEFEELKVRIHRELLEKLDLVALASLSREQGESQIRIAIARLLEQQSTPLSRISPRETSTVVPG